MTDMEYKHQFLVEIYIGAITKYYDLKINNILMKMIFLTQYGRNPHEELYELKTKLKPLKEAYNYWLDKYLILN